MRVTFECPSKLIIGQGKSRELTAESSELGNMPFVVSDASADLFLEMKTLSPTLALRTSDRPSIEDAIAFSTQARTKKCDHVIAIGAGATIDLAKTVALMLPQQTEMSIEQLGTLSPDDTFAVPPAPLLAMPIEAGCGAESSDGAGLFCDRLGRPLSLRHPMLIPSTVLIDPELLAKTSPEVTATNGLHALCRLIEAMVTVSDNVVHELICAEGIHKIAENLRKAFLHGDRKDLRARIAIGTYYAGMVRANSDSRFVQELATPISERFNAPLGVVSAILMPAIWEEIIQNPDNREIASHMANRLNEITRLLTGAPGKDAEEALIWLQDLCEHMMIPGLQDYGVEECDLPEMIEAVRKTASDPALCRSSYDQISRILTNALHPPVSGEATLYM